MVHVMRGLVLAWAVGFSVAHVEPAHVEPPWMATCAVVLQAEAARLAIDDPRLLQSSVDRSFDRTKSGRDRCKPEARYDRLSLVPELPSAGAFFVVVEAGPGLVSDGRVDAPWQSSATHDGKGMLWSRVLAGRNASVQVQISDGSAATQRFIESMKSVADVCLSAVPIFEKPAPLQDDPRWRIRCATAHSQQEAAALERCIDAERAISEIETMCDYQSEVAGYGGAMGETYAALLRVLAAGASSTSYLLRLAHSKHPVARMAAVAGLRQSQGPIARRELRRLSKDMGSATAFYSCMGFPTRIGDLARDALHEGENVIH